MRTATVLLSMMLGLSPSQGRHRKNLLSERIGVCTGVSNADAVKRAGGHHIELGLSDFANPEKDDARFADDLQRALACGLPTCSTNGFFPGSIKVTGPLADHQRAVQYTETALRRAHEAGIKVCVLGSAGSRNIPDGFPRQEAEAQFVELLRKLAPIARKYDIVIAIEPLQKSESNFINTVQRRLDKFDRFFADEADAAVTVSREKDRFTVEITVKSRGFFFRTERTGTDLGTTFNEAADLMMRQIVKNKEKLGNRVRSHEIEVAGEEMNYAAPENEGEDYRIVREKTFRIEPMTEQEAVLQMDMLGHTFFVFRNSGTDEINIVYRRHDDSYGLLIPKG